MMVDFFYGIIFRVGCNKICSAWNKIVALIFNLLYPIYCKLNPVGIGVNKGNEKRQEEIIVSLTSFPARLKNLHLCIHSLLSQTKKPDRIILWLYRGECADNELPKELLNMRQFGLEIRYVEENLRPHKKLYYAMKEYPNAVIITVDDDNVYSHYLVERLVNAHEEHPSCVCCNMAHEIVIKDHLPDLYNNWKGGAIGKKGASNLFVAIGGGGVLYPPSCLGEDYYDVEMIKKLALSADDLWLKINEIRMNVPVYKVSRHSKIPFSISNTQEVALGKENNGNHKNDAVMKDLCAYYKINWDELAST